MARPLFVLAITVALIAGCVAIRRSESEDRDDYSEPELPKYEAPKQKPVDDSPASAKAPKAAEEAPPKFDGMVHVISILFISKTVPYFQDAGTMPMLISVMLAPRVCEAVAVKFSLHFEPGMPSYLYMAFISITMYSMIVNTAKSMGYCQPWTSPAMGKAAKSVAELDYVQGDVIDVSCPKSVKVVELWATWCGPCKTAIPHLNKHWKQLVSDFGNDHIKFVGISSEKVDVVKPFVTEMGDKMQYSVAVDETNSLEQAYPRQGIPHVYVVGKDGMICFSGHPGSKEFISAVLDALNNKQQHSATVKAAEVPKIVNAPAKEKEVKQEKPKPVPQKVEAEILD